MITLDFTPEKQAVIEQASQMAGMNMSDYIKENIYQDALALLGTRLYKKDAPVEKSEDLNFYTMWQDRFSDSDDIEVQQKEVNNLVKLFRKPRY